MLFGKTIKGRGAVGNSSVDDDVKPKQEIVEQDESLKNIDLKDVSPEGFKLENSSINFSRKAKSQRSYNIHQIKQNIIEGTFTRVVDAVVQPKFIKEAYAKADAQGKADIKVLAAVAIAEHGEKIAEGIRKNNNIDEIKDIPEHHISDVMKMSMQFGASSKSINAFMNLLHEAGKLPQVIEHLVKDMKSSDVINLTSTIMRLGLDPTPLTCAQSAFRLMSYALDRSGVQKTKQPVLFKFVSTAARGFQIGSNVLEAMGNVAGTTMISVVSGFIIHRVVDFSLRHNFNENVKYGDQDMKFSDAIIKLEKESECSEEERSEITILRESERNAKLQEVKKAMKQSQQDKKES